MPGVVTGNDAYYAANGRYSLFFTCNSWVNAGLKACQQKACYLTAFAGRIFYQYGKYGVFLWIIYILLYSGHESRLHRIYQWLPRP